MKRKMSTFSLILLLTVVTLHSSYGQNVNLRQLMSYEHNKLDKGTATACWLLFPCGGLAYTGSNDIAIYGLLDVGLIGAIIGTKNSSTVGLEAIGLAIVRIFELKDTYNEVDLYNAQLLNNISKDPMLALRRTNASGLQLKISLSI